MASKSSSSEQEIYTMEELLSNEKPIVQLQRGEVVEGTVIDTQRGEILVDVGAKAEGVVPANEAREEKDMVEGLKPGDQLLVYIVSAENEHGQIQLSLKKAAQARRWTTLQKSAQDETVLPVKVLDHNKGGLIVDAQKVRGFIPFSHLTSGPARTASPQEVIDELNGLVGQELQAVVIEADPKANRLILSEKKAQQEADKERKTALMSQLALGQVVDGTVARIMPFGLIIALEGGAEGLVHASEVDWNKSVDFSNQFEAGDKIKVKVIELDQENGKINLSLKQLTEDPWNKTATQYQVGQKVTANVAKITSYGVVLSVDGIEGLLKSDEAGKLKVGDSVEVYISGIDTVSRRLNVDLELVEQG
jgi:small subunit ribosomal protein S1